MRHNTTGLKKDIYKPLEDKLVRKLKVLPDIAVKFLHSTKKKIRTQIEYAKDLTLFFEFLVETGKVKKPNMTSVDIEDIKALQVEDVEDFLDYLLEYSRTYLSSKGKTVVQHFANSPAGIARKRATLARFFGFLVNRDYLEKDITKKLEAEDIPDTQGIKQRLQPEEIQQLFRMILEDEDIETGRLMKFHQKVKFRDYIIILLLAYTGIRVGELVQLDIDDIYLQRKYFEILRKGGKREQITMPKRIIEDISDYIESRKAMKDIPTNALFVSLRKKRLSDKTIREMMKKYQKRSRIEVHITPHIFRRTFGTNHYNTYKDMYLTAKTLGHSSAETTRKHYADPSKERVVKSMEEYDYDSPSETKIKQNNLQRLADKFGISIEELEKELNG
jgi:integrase/recombinase XerD